MTLPGKPRICGIIIHWHDEERLQELVEAWPTDPRFELLIVDNGSAKAMPNDTRIIGGKGNLGFAGAVNLGARSTEAPLVLIMNSDVRPRAGAIESLIRGFDRWPDTAALAPRLLGPDGRSQCRWQLRPLPKISTLLIHSLLISAGLGRSTEAAPGERIEQPAAAALAIRRQVLEEMGGFDERFYPAWFEDVDFAKRLQLSRHLIRYWPEAEFEHQLGSSVPRLGFGRFLRTYYTNLRRYLSKHHGRSWSLLSRLLIVISALLRLILVPIRKPRHAPTRFAAAKGLMGLAMSSACGWPLAATGDSPLRSSAENIDTSQ